MIAHTAFTVEPWAVTEEGLNLEVLAQSESVFALSNGHIGLRGNLDEGEPADLPGTYLNAFYETRPLPYAEAGYGYPEDGQTIVNVTNGKLIRLLVDDEPLDVRYGELLAHKRTLDLRAGVLRREVHWRSPSGREVKVRTTRLVSFVHRPVAAIRYEVEACDGQPLRVVVQSTLTANEPGPPRSGDPRAAAMLAAPLVAEEQELHDLRAVLVHRTRESGLRMAAGMAHDVDAPEGTLTDSDIAPDLARVLVSVALPPDETLRVTKYLAYGWSSMRSLPSIRDQVGAALASARRSGWDELVASQREYLDDFWTRGDVEIEGDEELQQAVRFALFHTLQAGARAERRAIPAKGLTGPGYDGHVFWDTESFVLPLLTYTIPKAACDALMWRHSTLDLARERAVQLGLAGSTFPWRTIRGQECSAYWPAGTAAFHVNADIADAVLRYLRATGDEDFARGAGLDLLVNTARMFRTLGHHDADGVFHIDGVTGPDEYSAIVDDNVYTNLMAERNLRNAADLAAAHPKEAMALGVDDEEIAAWRDAASAMHVPYDERRRVHPQDADFLNHAMADFETWEYPLLLNVPVLPALPPSGRQAARPGHGAADPRRPLLGRAEGARLRLLRSDHRARQLAVGVRAGGRGRRGRPPRPRVRLLRRGRADGPRRPGAQHARRAAHRVAGRLVACRGRRVRRDARLAPRPDVPPAPARRAVAAVLPRRRAHAPPARRGASLGRHVRAARGRADGDPPPRRADPPGGRRAGGRAAWTAPPTGPEPTQPPGRAPARRRRR